LKEIKEKTLSFQPVFFFNILQGSYKNRDRTINESNRKEKEYYRSVGSLIQLKCQWVFEVFSYFLFIKCLNVYQVHLRKSQTLLCIAKCQRYTNPVAESLWVASCRWFLHQLCSWWVARESSGNCVSCGTPTCQPFCS